MRTEGDQDGPFAQLVLVAPDVDAIGGLTIRLRPWIARLETIRIGFTYHALRAGRRDEECFTDILMDHVDLQLCVCSVFEA